MELSGLKTPLPAGTRKTPPHAENRLNNPSLLYLFCVGRDDVSILPAKVTFSLRVKGWPPMRYATCRDGRASRSDS